MQDVENERACNGRVEVIRYGSQNLASSLVHVENPVKKKNPAKVSCVCIYLYEKVFLTVKCETFSQTMLYHFIKKYSFFFLKKCNITLDLSQMFQNYPPSRTPLEFWMNIGAALSHNFHFRLPPHNFKSQFLFSLLADFYSNDILKRL